MTIRVRKTKHVKCFNRILHKHALSCLLLLACGFVVSVFSTHSGIAASLNSETEEDFSGKLNIRVLEENFGENSSRESRSLVIPDETQRLKMNPLVLQNLNMLDGSIEYKELFSAKDEKFQPDALKAIRKKQQEESYSASYENAGYQGISDSIQSIYNIKLSGKFSNKTSQKSSSPTKTQVKTTGQRLLTSPNSYMYSMMNAEYKVSAANASLNGSMDNFSALRERAIKMAAQKSFSSAEKILAQMLSYAKGDAAKLFMVAELYEKINKPEDACGLYNELVTTEPSNPKYLYSYAYSLYKNEQFELAQKYFLKTIELRADSAQLFNSYYNLGSLYYKKGDYYKALDNFNRAMEITPLNADVYFNIGVSLENINNSGLAKKYYSKCLELNPSDKQAAIALERLE